MNNTSKAKQENNINNYNAPIIFELGAIAGLFFKEEGVEQLFINDMLQIADVKTIDKERANIIIGLQIITEEYFELKFVITTTRGIERLSVYDKTEFLDSFGLKRWMHVGLCDEVRKSSLINDFPEYYSFDSSLFLA